MKFRATVELGGKTATGVEVPEQVVESLGPSKRPAVRATINGYTYRSSVASMGGRSCSESAQRSARQPASKPATRWTSTSNSTPNRAS